MWSLCSPNPEAAESLFLPSDGTCLLRCRIVTSRRTKILYLVVRARMADTTKLHIRLEQKDIECQHADA